MGHSRIFCDGKTVFAMSKVEELGLIFAEEPQALEQQHHGVHRSPVSALREAIVNQLVAVPFPSP